MSWEGIGQFCDLGIGLILIFRLLALRLHRVYRIFCLFLIADLAGSVLWMLRVYVPQLDFDYRWSWIIARAIVWIFTLWTVYALLGAMLANLPGILKFSRRLLKASFAIAIAAGLLSAFPEYAANNWVSTTRVDHMLAIAVVMDRVIASVALLALLGMLLFLLWFPVEMSRNLAVFSAGFVIYFAMKTALLLSRSFWSHESLQFVSPIIAILSSACLAYWAIFISSAGEQARARYGHIWEHKKQDRLLGQIEALNTSLLRAARR